MTSSATSSKRASTSFPELILAGEMLREVSELVKPGWSAPRNR